MGFAEGGVVALLAENHVEHRGEDRRVVSWPGLQKDVGEARDLTTAGIDHDQSKAALLRGP